MKQPTLVILAAGMGSRFGGLKQITAVDDFGHAIIDFSMYDAYRAGFRKVVFIIKHEIEEDFRKNVGIRAEKHFDVKYVFQQTDMLPAGYTLPAERVKPWGTAHAVLCAKDAVDGPFAVINADDFYGPTAYSALYDYLVSDHPETEHAMVAYLLRNTVTENGSVARGICEVEDGFLSDVVERTKIFKKGEDGEYTEDGETFICLSGETPVSMNFWGFTPDYFKYSEDFFVNFLKENIDKPKSEFFIPSLVNELVEAKKSEVKVLTTESKWFGVTYSADRPEVVAKFAQLHKDGVYPEKLF